MSPELGQELGQESGEVSGRARVALQGIRRHTDKSQFESNHC